MVRTQTRPLDDPRLWRRLLSRAHPDAGGDGELFVWTGALKDAVCGGELHLEPRRHEQRRPASPPDPSGPERITYPDGQSFEAGTVEALRMAEELGTYNMYGGLLAMLADCEPMARYAHQQERGASYKQLAAIGHTVGMSGPERSGWYAVAKGILLSDRHASHILGRLKSAAA